MDCKYVQVGNSGKAPTKWHSNPQCLALKEEAGRIVQISEARARELVKCKICEARDNKLAALDKETDIRRYLTQLTSISIIVEKQVSREFLRDELRKRELPFNLRESKLRLSRKYCKACFRECDISKLIEFNELALRHWQERIEKKDLHRPEYFVQMRDRSLALKEQLPPVQIQLKLSRK